VRPYLICRKTACGGSAGCADRGNIRSIKKPRTCANVIKIKDSADLKIESALSFILMTLRTRSHVFLFYQKPKMYMNAPCGLVPAGLPASFSVCWKKSRDTVLSEKK
jgi:hypothetical protein